MLSIKPITTTTSPGGSTCSRTRRRSRTAVAGPNKTLPSRMEPYAQWCRHAGIDLNVRLDPFVDGMSISRVRRDRVPIGHALHPAHQSLAQRSPSAMFEDVIVVPRLAMWTQSHAPLNPYAMIEELG